MAALNRIDTLDIDAIEGMVEQDSTVIANELLGIHNRLKDLVERVKVQRDLTMFHLRRFHEIRSEIGNVSRDISRYMDGIALTEQENGRIGHDNRNQA